MRAKGFAAVAAVMFVGVAFAGAGSVREMKRVALGDTYAVFSVETEGTAPDARCGVSYWMEGFEDDAKTAWCDSPVSAGAEGKIVSVRGLVAEFDYLMAPVIGVGDGEDREIVANGRTVAVTTAAEKGGAAVSIDAASLKALPVEVTFGVLVESLGDADSAELKLEYGVKGAGFNESVALGMFEELPGKYVLRRLRGLASGKEYEMRVRMSGGCSAVSKAVGFTVPEEACRTAWVEYPDGGKGVAFIRPTGEQMIDTGVVPGPDTSLELRFARPKTDAEDGSRLVFGQDFGTLRYALYHANGRLSFGGMGDQLNTPVLKAESNYVCRITCTAGSENGTVAVGYAGAELKGDRVPLTTDVQMPLVLFMTPSGERASVYDLQSLRIEKGGACVRDFRPALDGKDVPCLYDAVGKTYFYNTRKGAPFQVGPRSVAPTSDSFVAASVVAFDGTTLVADVTRRKGGRASALYACFGPDYGGAETNGWAKCVRLGEPFALMAETVAATVPGIAPADAYLRFWSETDGWSPTLALAGLKATPDPKPILAVRDIAVRNAGAVDVELDLRALGTGAAAADICAEFAASDDPATDKTVKKTAKAGVRTARDLYVQDGLLACWDGEEGLSKDTWRDLVAGVEFVIRKGVYDSTNCCLVYNGQGPDELKGGARWVFPYGAKTIELVTELNSSIALMTPEWAGCTIGEWNRMVLLHNRQRSNAMPYKPGSACTYSVSYAADNALIATSYLNGKAVEQLKANEWYDANGYGNACIGGRVNAGSMNGRIYALRVYNRILDAAEIAANAAVDRRRFGCRNREKLIGEREVVTETKLPQVAFGSGKTVIRTLASGVTATGPRRFAIEGLWPGTNYAIRFFATNGTEGGRAETAPEGFATEKENFGALVSPENAAVVGEFANTDNSATTNNILRGIVGERTSGNVCNGDVARLTDGVVRNDRGDVWVGDGDTEITWKFGRLADIAAVRLCAHWSDVRSVIDVTAIEFRGADGQWRTAPNSNFGGGGHGTRTLAVFAPKDRREILAAAVDAMRIKFNNSDAHGGCRGWRAYREIEAVESVETSGILKLENSAFDAGTFTGEVVRGATSTNACDAVFACYGPTYGGAGTNGWANVRRIPQGFAAGETTLKAKVEGLPADFKYLRFFADRQGWTDSFCR